MMCQMTVAEQGCTLMYRTSEHVYFHSLRHGYVQSVAIMEAHGEFEKGFRSRAEVHFHQRWEMVVNFSPMAEYLILFLPMAGWL